MMSLKEFLPYFFGREGDVAAQKIGGDIRINTSGSFHENWGFKDQFDLSIPEFFDYMIEETKHLSNEELVALVVTAKMVTNRRCSWFILALKWAMYLRNIPLQPVNDDHQNSSAVQAPDPVGPDVP
jgi:hypothetical protein